MKPHVKEILKNKADKMVDLIIDDIGTDGHKRLTSSFLDEKRKDTKYVIELTIRAGDPEEVHALIDDEDIPAKVEELMTRLTTLEEKEDQDTIYDDTELQERITALEEKEDQDTIYDDSILDARITALENKQDQDTIYDDTNLRNEINTIKGRVTNIENDILTQVEDYLTNLMNEELNEEPNGE